MLSCVYGANADWRRITVEKLNRRGETELTAAGMPKQFRYDLESSTGDLYGFKGDPDAPETVAAKSLLIFCITPLYLAGMICAHLLKTASDILSIFWKVLPQLIKDLSAKGPGASFGNTMMAVFIEIPLEIGADLLRICRSPFFAVALEIACLYTMISPYEGRKWIGKIENLWHEGLHYHLDVRDTDPARCFEEIVYDGKILFLGICMQRMGNIHDKVRDLDKYRILQQ